MKITESKIALYEALVSISADAAKRGMKAKIRCFTANHDLEEVDENDAGAVLIAGEIRVTSDEKNDKEILLECALSVEDGEVSEDEILREIGNIRSSMKEVCDTFDNVGSAESTFDSIEKEQQLPAEEPKTFDNKQFYIWGSIIAAIALIFTFIMTKF